MQAVVGGVFGIRLADAGRTQQCLSIAVAVSPIDLPLMQRDGFSGSFVTFAVPTSSVFVVAQPLLLLRRATCRVGLSAINAGIEQSGIFAKAGRRLIRHVAKDAIAGQSLSW
jgi:hypothetical protein